MSYKKALKVKEVYQPKFDKMGLKLFIRQGFRGGPIFYDMHGGFSVIEAIDFKGEDPLKNILPSNTLTREEKEADRFLPGVELDENNTFIHPRTLQKVKVRKFIDRDYYIKEFQNKYREMLERYQFTEWKKEGKNPEQEKRREVSFSPKGYTKLLFKLLKPSIEYHKVSLKIMIEERCLYKNKKITSINILERSKIMYDYTVYHHQKYAVLPTRNQVISQFEQRRTRRRDWKVCSLPLPEPIHNPWPLVRERDKYYNKVAHNVQPKKYIPPKFVPEIVITKKTTYITKKPKTPKMMNVLNRFLNPINFKNKLEYIGKLGSYTYIKQNIEYKTVFFWTKKTKLKGKVKNFDIVYNKKVHKYYIKNNRPIDHFRQFRWNKCNKYLEKDADNFYKVWSTLRLPKRLFKLKKYDYVKKFHQNKAHKRYLKKDKYYKRHRSLNHIYSKYKYYEMTQEYKRGRGRHRFPVIENNFYIWTWNRFLYINHYLFKRTKPSLSIHFDHRFAFLKTQFDNYKPKVYPVVKANHLRFPTRILYLDKYHLDYNLVSTIRTNKNRFNDITYIIKNYPQFYGKDPNEWDHWETQDLIALTFSCVTRPYYNHLLHWITDYKVRECFYTNDQLDNEFAWSRSTYNNNKYHPKFPFRQKKTTKLPLIFDTTYPYYFHKDQKHRKYTPQYPDRTDSKYW